MGGCLFIVCKLLEWCCAHVQKAINVYATATLSGDVANALALLKRMTRPTTRKQKSGLLIAPKELACCHVRPLCH